MSNEATRPITALSDDPRFQQLCLEIFTSPKGAEFLQFFNTMMLHHPIVDLDTTPYHAYYQDGFFSVFREINQSLEKLKIRQQSQTKKEVKNV